VFIHIVQEDEKNLEVWWCISVTTGPDNSKMLYS